MGYNPEVVKTRYDNYGDREWTRLESDAHGVLLYEVHKDILNRHIKPEDTVLEIGAGSGRYTKDLVEMCNQLVVADISTHQIEFNKKKMKELGHYEKVKSYHTLDMINMDIFEDNTFDNVVCIGGPLSYLMDKEKDGVSELLRVTKPNGTIIIGVMGFIGSSMYYMDGILHEKKSFGIEAMDWMFNTGLQDGDHYPVASKHYCHMFKSHQLDELFAQFDVEVIEKSSAGLFTLTSDCGNDRLENVRQDKEMWDLIVQKEIEFTKYPGTLDCGMNIIYVIKKMD